MIDLAGFLDQQPQLDWENLISQARQRGCLRMVLLGLQLADTLCSLNVTPACRTLIAQDSKVADLSREVMVRLRAGEFPPMNPYPVDRYSLALRERWSEKVGLLLRTTFTPRAQHYELVSLPSSLTWLYVPIKLGVDYVALPIWGWIKGSPVIGKRGHPT